jgi:hypothetical protein
VISSNSSYLCGAAWRTYGLEELHICFVVVSPLLGNIVFIVNGFNWTNWLTCTAVNALIRVDVKHAVTLVDAIYWALLDAGLVL